MWRVWVGFNISHGVGRCFSPVVFSTGDGAALRWQRLGAYQEPQRHYHRLQRLAESPALLAEAIKGGQSGKRGYLHRRSPGFYPGYEVSRSAGLVGDRARSPMLGKYRLPAFFSPPSMGSPTSCGISHIYVACAPRRMQPAGLPRQARAKARPEVGPPRVWRQFWPCV